MPLRAKQPEIKESTRAKILISGAAGAGKSYFSMQFPTVYYIDSEQGGEREQYQELLKKSGGVYFGRESGASDFDEVIKEFKSLATEKHPYKTVVVDSLSYLYNQKAAEAELKVGSAFAADKKEANKPTRQLLRWIDKIDLNVVLIAHQKSDWSNRDKDGQPGTTFDAYDKVSYELDLWLELVDKKFIVRKTRIDAFKEGMVFDRAYKEFAQLFGQQGINKEVTSIVLATEGEIKLATKFAQGLNMSEEELLNLWKKANVESWDEMTQKQIQSCIKYLGDKIDKLKTDK